MKKLRVNPLEVLFLFCSLFFLVSCTEDEDSVTPDTMLLTSVSPSDANALSGVLIIPGVTRTNGSLPASTDDSAAPIISGNQSATVSSNGSTIPLSFNYENVSTNLAGGYLQVAGAGDYFVIPLSQNSGSNGQIQIPVTIPAQVTAGSFTLIYSVYDTEGRVSNVLSTDFNNLALGTGALQVSLSWNTATDMDLYVTDPNGEEIYYSNTSSESGGALDRDDLDGYGPENIFWDDNALDGLYTVEVNDYDNSSLLQSWVVTITSAGSSKTFSGTLQNGDTKTVTTFTKSGSSLSF